MIAPPALDDFPAWVAQLGDSARAQRAYWHLVVSGATALPAVRTGLGSSNDDIRTWCTKILDHLVDAESFPVLVEMLDDPDPGVRIEALHALACDRCKDNACRPDAALVLDRAIEVLHHDPDAQVRARACEVVGRWVHDHDAAATALTAAHAHDPSPAVRKKAGWYAPGGVIHAKTAPR